MSAPNQWMKRLSRQRTNSSGEKKSLSSNSPPDLSQRSNSYDEDLPSGPSTPPLSISDITLYSQSSATNSPSGSSSVPKKSWERHFRSFLSRSSKDPGSREDELDVQHRGIHGTPPGSPGSHRSNTLDDTNGLHRSRRHTMDNSPNALPRVDATVSDSAVRGGSQFQTVFSNQKPAAEATTREIYDDNNVPDTKVLSKSYEADSSLDQRGRRFKSSDSLDNRIYRDTSAGSRLEKFRLLAPNQRIPEGELSKLGEMNRSGGPSALATSLEISLGNLGLNTQNHHQSSHKRGGVQREMKVAFTEFHNSSRDTNSAFLGDEKSIAGGKIFASLAQENRLVRTKSGREVQEDVAMPISGKPPLSLLNPVTGTDSWTTGRRYSLVPAIISIVKLETLSVLLGPIHDENNYGSRNTKSFTFGRTILGEADISLLDTTASSQEVNWTRKRFLLAVNYLLEYDVSDDFSARPRGFAHLEHASVYPHSHLENVLILDVFMLPSARDDRKIFLLRLSSKQDMEEWVSRLASCTKLLISNFFDFDSSDDGAILGTGRYATIRPAKRLQGHNVVKDMLLPDLSSVSSTGDLALMGKTRPGIMKKKPSFSSLSMTSLPAEFDCALKIINKNLFWDRVAKKQERLDAIVRETAVQATLTAFYGHLPIFLKLNTVFETSDHYIMELEFSEGSKDLFKYVSSSGHLPEIEAAYIVQDLLAAIDALKRLGIAHRDIKPANIFMIGTDNKNGSRVKLGDFGMAAFVGEDNKLYGRCGTPGYVAPEILSVGVNHGYENKVDVFSLGVTMYILLCGYEPFYGETDEELISANKEAKVDFPDSDWKNVSIEGRDLVEKLLEPDPKKRIDSSDALKHPWITRRTSRPVWMEKIVRGAS